MKFRSRDIKVGLAASKLGITGPAANTILAILLAAVVAIRCLITVNLPLQFLVFAGHDDGLFMRLGRELAMGNWLGTYNQFTLMKGPGYPIFLALASLSGLPVSLAHAFLQMAAVLATAWAVLRLTGSRMWAALAFLLLALHPITVIPELQRVFREQIYWPQTLLVVALFSVLMMSPPHRPACARRLAILCGTILAWAWLTREESVWFLPGLLVLAGGAALRVRGQKSAWIPLVTNVGVTAAAFVALHAVFLTINWIAFGSFAGLDIKERNFVRSLDALQSIDAGPATPYVPVPLAARAEAAKVSPTFERMSVSLAPGGTLYGWSEHGCKFYKSTCGDIAGGWFIWAYRDAAALQGFYRTPALAAEGFKHIADEITEACNSGRLHCRATWLSYLPHLTQDQLSRLPAAVYSAARKLAFLEHPNLTDAPWQPPPDNLAEAWRQYWHFLNRPLIAEGFIPEQPLVRTALASRERLVLIYRWLMPALIAAGLVAYAVSMWRALRGKGFDAALLVATSAWTMIAIRIVLLGLIDISSFPGSTFAYVAPASYLAALASVLSLASLGRPLRGASDTA